MTEMDRALSIKQTVLTAAATTTVTATADSHLALTPSRTHQQFGMRQRQWSKERGVN